MLDWIHYYHAYDGRRVPAQDANCLSTAQFASRIAGPRGVINQEVDGEITWSVAKATSVDVSLNAHDAAIDVPRRVRRHDDC